MNPTQNDIREAKSYIRQRLEAELKMEHYLDSALVKAAREIVELAYKWSIPPTLFSFNYDPFLSREVDKIITRLLSQIEDYDVALAVSAYKSDKDALIPYIYRDINGITYTDRLNHYTNKFKLELQDFVAAGLVAGLSKQETLKEILSSYKDPYKNSIISNVSHRGHTSYKRLLVLTRHTIADAWMHADEEWMLKNGATGYVVYRGSSYPCSVCDMMCGYHPINDYVLPVHPNCCCYAVPIYNK